MADKAAKKKSASANGAAPTPTPRLRTQYETEVFPALKKEFGFENGMRVPRLEKIVVNMGCGDALQNIKLLDAAVKDLSMITGQRPSIRRSKRAISNFKLREEQPIGCAVTLRGKRMWEFYDRLVNVVVPRIRDFRGFSMKSFDGRGNYTVGIKEHVVFPEIEYDKVAKVRGMDVTFVTSAMNDEEGRALMTHMKWPFRQR
jgi:large subunit ribosomal protein L5